MAQAAMKSAWITRSFLAEWRQRRCALDRALPSTPSLSRLLSRSIISRSAALHRSADWRWQTQRHRRLLRKPRRARSARARALAAGRAAWRLAQRKRVATDLVPLRAASLLSTAHHWRVEAALVCRGPSWPVDAGSMAYRWPVDGQLVASSWPIGGRSMAADRWPAWLRAPYAYLICCIGLPT